MSGLTRDGTAEPVSRDQNLRRERGQGNIHFPCSADHEEDWQPNLPGLSKLLHTYIPIVVLHCYCCYYSTTVLYALYLYHEGAPRLERAQQTVLYSRSLGIFPKSLSLLPYGKMYLVQHSTFCCWLEYLTLIGRWDRLADVKTYVVGIDCYRARSFLFLDWRQRRTVPRCAPRYRIERCCHAQFLSCRGRDPHNDRGRAPLRK